MSLTFLDFETVLTDGILALLRSSQDIKDLGIYDIEQTEFREKLPEEFGTKAIQVHDPSSDFETAGRSKYKEFPECVFEVYCYISNFEHDHGEVSKELSKVVGAVIKAIHNKSIQGYYKLLVMGVEASDPIFISRNEAIDEEDEPEILEPISVKTVRFRAGTSISTS